MSFTGIYMMPYNSYEFYLYRLPYASVRTARKGKLARGRYTLSCLPWAWALPWSCELWERQQCYHDHVSQLLIAAAVSYCTAVFPQSTKPQKLQLSYPAGISLQFLTPVYQKPPLPTSPFCNFLLSIPRFWLLIIILGIYKDGSPSN